VAVASGSEQISSLHVASGALMGLKDDHDKENMPLSQTFIQNNTVQIQVDKFQVQKNGSALEIPQEILQLVLNQQKIDVLNAQKQNPAADMVSKLVDHFVKKK
jgi:hypothetical protein